MEDKELDNLEIFLKKKKKEKKDFVEVKDGLFERHEIINKKLYTKDGKQLLKETLFED